MIEYNKEKREISLTEWINWENHVLPIYREIYEYYKDDLEVTEDTAEDLAPIPPEKLSSEEIDEIMQRIVDQWELEEYRVGDYAAVALYECIRHAVEEWCEENFVE